MKAIAAKSDVEAKTTPAVKVTSDDVLSKGVPAVTKEARADLPVLVKKAVAKQDELNKALPEYEAILDATRSGKDVTDAQIEALRKAVS